MKMIRKSIILLQKSTFSAPKVIQKLFFSAPKMIQKFIFPAPENDTKGLGPCGITEFKTIIMHVSKPLWKKGIDQTRRKTTYL